MVQDEDTQLDNKFVINRDRIVIPIGALIKWLYEKFDVVRAKWRARKGKSKKD